MHICVYGPNGVFSLLVLFASTGTVVQDVALNFLFTRHSTWSYSGSTHTIIQYKVSYSRRALIHYTVMCFEAPLSKRRQSGVWSMLACSDALSCALKRRCQGDDRVASVGVLQRRHAFFAEYGAWSSRRPASCFAETGFAPDVCPNLRRRFRIMGTSSALGSCPPCRSCTSYGNHPLLVHQ